MADENDDDIERKAILEQTGVDTDAAGEAEVEFAKTSPASAVFVFAIDGIDIATATADRRGQAEVELEVRMQ